MKTTDADIPTRWEPRPGVAALVRSFALLAPIAASVLFVHVASQIVGAPSGSALRHVVWWIGLSASATAVLIGIDRLTRRLLPLAALLKLALVFPDEAPSRFRTALRAGTTTELEGRLEQAKHGADAGTPVEAAERLLGFVTALSTHDRVTRGHSERVRAYAQMIAKELHLGRAEVDRLNWAALLHDIGKLGVPAEVLNKPGEPTAEEWELIRLHPEHGARLAAPLRTWLGEWTDAVSDHHERWDGSGYPNGTVGEDISLAGRIVAVADVFDVITSARSYKKSGTAITAREEIARCAGGQFDPRVVRAFLSISLGRLRLAMGPLSWLAQAPVLGRIPLGPGMATAASSAVAVVGALAAGLVSGSHVPTQLATAAAAAGSPAVHVAYGGRLAEAARALPGRRGGKARTPAPAPVSGPVLNELIAALPVPGDPPPPEAPIASPPPSPVSPPVSPPAAPPEVVPAGPAGPSFAPGADQRVREDAGPQRVPSWAGDIRGRGVTFTASDDNSALFRAGAEPALDAEGTLTYTPAADASGTAHVTIRALAGDGRRSRPATLTITVAPVNDAPGFVAGSDQTVREDSGPHSLANWARAITPGPAGEAGQSASFTVSSDNPSLFALGGRPAIAPDGTLTYTPAADASGAANVTVRAVDDGGTAAGGSDTSAAQTFLITVAPVNDAPAFVGGVDQTVLENAAPQTVAAWATAITPGPSAEGAQVVSFAVSSSDASLFLAGGQPAVAGNGSLTFSPATGAHGVATVTVRAVDDGGTAAGGVDASAPQTFTITIVNQATSANADAPGVLENDPAGVTFDVLANDTDPESDPLTVASYDESTIANGSLTDNGGGSFTYVPATHFSGTDTFSYTVSDVAGNTATAVVTITVTAVPDPPAAADDAYVTPQGVPLVQPAPGLLQNDADSGGGALVVDTTPVVSPANGVLSLAPDGSFTYTPAPGFVGSDAFTYRATSLATGLSADAVATITVAATFSSSLLYLTGSGPSSEVWNVSPAAPAASFFVPDYDSDGAPGLTIKSGNGSDSGDPRRSQTWRYPLAAALVLNGPVSLHLSSAGNNSGVAYVYLYDCLAGGASCVQIGFGSLADSSWNGFLSWGQHDISVGTVNRALPAGNELRVRVYVGQGEQWVAMTAALPSSLTLTVP